MTIKQIVTVGIRARFSLRQIEDFWAEFNRQAYEDPGETYFRVGQHSRWWHNQPYTQDVLVKIDEYPDGKVATMLLSDEF